MIHLKPPAGSDGLELAGWTTMESYSGTASLSEAYLAWTEATAEERVLVGVFGVAIVLMAVIVGIVVSQYVVCWGSCSPLSSLF
jgi:hypothetical protein